jgi:hypothetical protein
MLIVSLRIVVKISNQDASLTLAHIVAHVGTGRTRPSMLQPDMLSSLLLMHPDSRGMINVLLPQLLLKWLLNVVRYRNVHLWHILLKVVLFLLEDRPNLWQPFLNPQPRFSLRGHRHRRHNPGLLRLLSLLGGLQQI